MDATSKNIYQEISEKLKKAPKDILERVLGYVDGVLEENKVNSVFEQNQNYQLSPKQKCELEAMENLSEENFMSSEEFHKNIKEKYGL